MATMTKSQVLALRTAALLAQATSWEEQAASFRNLLECQFRSVDSSRDYWTGSAAETMRAKFDSLHTDSLRLVAALEDGTSAARTGAADLSAVRTALVDAIRAAESKGYEVAEDGTVTIATSTHQTLLAQLSDPGMYATAAGALQNDADALTSTVKNALARAADTDGAVKSAVDAAFAPLSAASTLSAENTSTTTPAATENMLGQQAAASTVADFATPAKASVSDQSAAATSTAMSTSGGGSYSKKSQAGKSDATDATTKTETPVSAKNSNDKDDSKKKSDDNDDAKKSDDKKTTSDMGTPGVWRPGDIANVITAISKITGDVPSLITAISHLDDDVDKIIKASSEAAVNVATTADKIIDHHTAPTSGDTDHKATSGNGDEHRADAKSTNSSTPKPDAAATPAPANTGANQTPANTTQPQQPSGTHTTSAASVQQSTPAPASSQTNPTSSLMGLPPITAAARRSADNEHRPKFDYQHIQSPGEDLDPASSS